KDRIEKFIKDIPAIPENVKKCADLIEEGELVKAANVAALDHAFVGYLLDVINKPIFGFGCHIRDIHQVFGILGVEKSFRVVNAYYASLILPKKWEVFDMDNADFRLLQSNLIYHWNKISSALECEDLHIASVVSLLPASLAVCEEIFKSDVEDIKLLKSHKNISYDDILFEMTGMRIFDIFDIICKKWELHQEALRLIEYLSSKNDDGSLFSKLAKYLHLLMFFELSKPKFIKAGVNDFVDFDTSFVEDIYPDFIRIIEAV
ncbi:MAG: histidine kinase, partial [Epsilonproteobacteria bacterium]|nr:histidine kinase [Campylobacterota bacterium]